MMEIATLGGGCFWCLDAPFRELPGVASVVSGYAGGHLPDPDYRSVCEGGSGHAEVVQVRFDPSVLSYRDLLRAFFFLHDPTTLNRQGNDIGTQYRSVIFWHDEAQRSTAEEVMAEVAACGFWDAPLVTQLLPVPVFYPAEEYHQDYFHRNPEQGYCAVVIAPKLAKFRSLFLAELTERLRSS